jgi:hypothetical protein
MKAKNSQEAAEAFYKDISSHFNNSIREFNFSIQKGSSGEGQFYHFKVKERRNKSEVDYSIAPLKIRGETEHVAKFREKLSNFKSKFDSQNGGKKSKKSKKSKDSSDTDSSDSDSDSELTEQYYKRAKKYIATNQPIYYWWYDPYLYNLSSLYLPTFYSYVTPYIELNLTY